MAKPLNADEVIDIIERQGYKITRCAECAYLDAGHNQQGRWYRCRWGNVASPYAWCSHCKRKDWYDRDRT